jgi:heme/copper-type cytochrome/quinol oxidase subunit 3
VELAAHAKGSAVSTIVEYPPPRVHLSELPIDQSRGITAVWFLIATETTLFACMFGAYYYLGANTNRWAVEKAPNLAYPLVLLVILLASSVVIHWGEGQVEREQYGRARAAAWTTVAMGLVFLYLQTQEYITDWKQVTPDTDSYGSILYTLTSLHAAHVIVGVLLLMYLGVLPQYGKARQSPHQPYQVISRYWHFVDAMWVLIVTLLFVIPQFQAH